MNNEDIIFQLEKNENEAKQNVETILHNTNSEIFKNLYEFWQNFDRESAIVEMLNAFKQNITSFWTNPRFNKDLSKKFNMILLSHGGVYGGELEAFAINFQNGKKELLTLEITDERYDYLDNISSLEAFIIHPLSDFTMKIQGEENNFDDWDDLMTMYTLYEATAHILAHKVFSIANKENILQSNFNIEKPFYMAISEHDSGIPDKIIYQIPVV
ncbi:hypothetical protein KB553_15585 [Chryseobacterium rhizoplanae]|uniref:hypothetical protein n=1 Tax=Chryseobacterium rhizoplanae TaxID=1609531 RepID=UPI001CE31724|nr:hypothetical protein [Chryseobacterium rhizoplanae]UCA58463.1 hypothetical protein KB553_15585 [Chryseobacterium rhizoplanae]